MKRRIQICLIAALTIVLFALIATPAGAIKGVFQQYIKSLRVDILKVEKDATIDDDLTVGDDLTVTDDATVGGDASVTGATDLTGAVTSSVGAITITDNVMIDGAADALQLTVQGYTTQTADLFVVETSAGTDLVTTDVTNTIFAHSVTQSDGDLTVADDLGIDQQSVITVTNGAAFTPTGTYQQIASADEVTPTIAMGDANDVLMLVNTTDTTINIEDSGTTMLSAAWTGGQYDTLVLLCDGTNWLELSRTDN